MMGSDQNDRPDLVYIVGPGGPGSTMELIYSIRSMCMHLSNRGRLIIIGHCPAEITPDIHISMDDPHPCDAAKNIFQKTFAAVDLQCVSDPFLCCADDYFLLQDFDARFFPYYYSQDLAHSFGQYNPLNSYRRNIQVTMEVLNNYGWPTLDFNVHAPILYNKGCMSLVKAAYGPIWESGTGLLLKSAYCNTLGISGRQLADCKIATPKSAPAIARALRGRPWFSTGEYGLNAEMLSFLSARFPIPSLYESVKNN